jgi:large subunit ribosomal protein L10
MAINKAKKKEIVEKLEKSFSGAKSIVFLGVKGIKVNEQNKLRKTLREQGVGYTIAKKTLVGRALDTAKLEGVRPDFLAELAVAYSEDNLATHREISDFQKKNKDNVKIIGGVFEGVYVDAAKVSSLASIPSLQTLRAQFVNIINSPIQGFVMALSEIAKSKPQA